VNALKPSCTMTRSKAIDISTDGNSNSDNNHLYMEETTYVDSDQWEISVPVYLNTNVDLFNLVFDIEFDPTKLEATALIKDSSRVISSPSPTAIDNILGKIIINIFDMSGATAVTAGRGKILDVVFHKKPSFTEGSEMLSINNIRDVYSTSATQIYLTSENGILFINNQISFEMTLPKGWSMISLPVIPSNATVSSLFPDAVVIYGYEKGVGCERMTAENNLEGEKGYWILLDQNQTYTLKGQPVPSYTHTVSEDGWCMIGGCHSSGQVSGYNCDISVIYDYVQGIFSTNIFLCVFNHQRMKMISNYE